MLFNHRPLILTEAGKKEQDPLDHLEPLEDDEDDKEPTDGDKETDEPKPEDDEEPQGDESDTLEDDESGENDDLEPGSDDGSEEENSETNDELGSDTEDDENLSEIDEKVKENPLKVRNLYEEYKLLYKGISNTIERIGKFSPSTPIEASLLSYIQEALTDLKQKLYFFLTEVFTGKGYEENLVTFFSFQAAIVSIRELINRLAILDSDNQNS